MRVAVIIAILIDLTGCTKTTLPPVADVTRVEVRSCRSQYDYFGAITAPDKLSELMEFINRPRSSWTRTFVFDFGVPRALVRADLYDGDTYVGYFAVGGGLLPGKRAFSRFGEGTLSLASPFQFLRPTRLLILSARGVHD
jgi:hypothetical protein